MSVPVARTPRSSGGSVQATRQQLDELDALLQRMLALPVNQAEEERFSPPEIRAVPADEPLTEASIAPTLSVAAEPQSPALEANFPPEPPHEILRPVLSSYQPPSPPVRTAPPRPTTPAANPSPAVPPRVGSPRPAGPVATPGRSAPPAAAAEPRSYPPSYMVIETATPQFFTTHEPAVSDRPPTAPRLVPPGEPYPAVAKHEPSYPQPPVPGGSHHLVEDALDDPVGDLAQSQVEHRQEGEWVPLHSSWQPSAQTWKPLAETWEQARVGTPARPAVPEPPMMASAPRPIPGMPSWRETVIPPPPGFDEPDHTSPASEPAAAEPSPSSTVVLDLPARVVAAPRVPLVLMPLVWFNQGFDLLLLPFGPLGRFFKGTGGRTILSTVGLLCLAAAIVLAVVEGFGWTP